jgi:hypothetical protein
MSFSNSILKYYGVKPLLVASGHKGYHVYVFFNRVVQFPTFRQEFIKSVYEEVQKRILKGLKFETLDHAPLGDIKRLARVPFSVHEKTGTLCQPVDLNRQPIMVQSLEEYRENGLETKLLETICKEIIAKEKLERILAEKRRLTPFKGKGGIRPCLETALKLPLHKGEGHKMRHAIATEYLNKGFTVPQVADLFRSQVDFNEERSRYFVEDAQKKAYKPFKCSKIEELGFCLEASCPIYKKRHRVESLVSR